MEKITAVIEKSGTGYAAFLPELPGCVSTGATLDELTSNMQEAISFHLEGMRKDEEPIPDIFVKEFELQFNFDIETFLGFYGQVFTRRALSRITGINESLLSQYASGLKRPRPLQAKKIERGLHRLANELLQISL